MTADLVPTSSTGDELACEAARYLDVAGTADELACEASRYLDVVEAFARLGADPHAAVRVRAALARHAESQSAQTTGKEVRLWQR